MSETKQTKSLDDIIGSVAELPTLPTVIAKITTMTSNPQTNAADVGKLIGNDPALSSKILKLVNSAYYGFPRKINSVTKAIVLLGFNKVKNIALSASVVEVFKNSAKLSRFDFLKFWEHSVAVGIAAEAIAKRLRPEIGDDAFVGGLLHDLGKVVIVNFVPDAESVFAAAEAKKVAFYDAAAEALGYDQGKVGSLVAEGWNFPEVLVVSQRYWAHPERTRQMREIVGCVHMANVFASAMGMTAPGDYAMPMLNRDVWDEYKMTQESVETLLTETLTGFKNAAAFLELAQ